MKKYLLTALLSYSSLIFAEPRLRPNDWAQPIIGTQLENCFKVSEKLYRSEQPNPKSFAELESYGIKGVLNLRRYHSDDDEAEKTSLQLHALKMNAGSVTQDNIIDALKVIRNSPGPVLVHCWHGSDRTGTIVAAYRIVIQNWPKQKAIDEMRNGGYGYHATIYPNLVKLLKELDVEEVKKKLQS